MASYFAHSINQVDKDGVDSGDCLTCVLANPGDKAVILAAIRANLNLMNVMRDARVEEARAEFDEALAAKDARIAELESQPPIPTTSVTQRQFRLSLLGLGVDPDQITAMLQAIPDELQRKAALIEWEWASAIQRDNPLVAQLASALGKSDAEIDALFDAARSL